MIENKIFIDWYKNTMVSIETGDLRSLAPPSLSKSPNDKP